jgi:hypothetical protein
MYIILDLFVFYISNITNCNATYLNPRILIYNLSSVFSSPLNLDLSSTPRFLPIILINIATSNFTNRFLIFHQVPKPSLSLPPTMLDSILLSLHLLFLSQHSHSPNRPTVTDFKCVSYSRSFSLLNFSL